MTGRLSAFAAAALLLAVAPPASAHRLDEYLQAAALSVTSDRIRVDVRLAPGVAVVPLVLALVDANRDGVLSAGEQQAYAERVLSDVSLSVDGEPLHSRLVSFSFPDTAVLNDGRGEIGIAFEADVPRGGAERRLVLENHHEPRIAAYLVNALVPEDPRVRIIAQRRDHEQTRYEMDYTVARRGGHGPSARAWMAAFTAVGVASVASWWRRRASSTRMRRTVILLLIAAGMAAGGCSSTPIPPTYTQDELRAICERQRGWWHPDDLIGGYCEYRGG